MAQVPVDQRTPMEHRFDVVTIGVEHEGAVIPGVVMRAWARGAVVAAAGGKRRLVERADQLLRFDAERHVDRRPVRLALVDPEVGLAPFTETGDVGAAGDVRGQDGKQLVTDGGKGLLVKVLAALEVADDETGVIDHGSSPGKAKGGA